MEIQRVAKSCLQTGALAREHDKLCRQQHETGTVKEREREREREREERRGEREIERGREERVCVCVCVCVRVKEREKQRTTKFARSTKVPWWLLESRAENTKRGNKNKINGAYPYSGGCKLHEDPSTPVRPGENVATPTFYFRACTSHYARTLS